MAKRLLDKYEQRRFMMAKQDILYNKEDGIGIITLNRPEKLNALTHEMLHRINSIIEDIKKDDTVRAVILTGNGSAFSAGTDISSEVPQTAEIEINLMKEKTSTEYRQSLWFFNSIPKPVICAINGAAVGIAAEFSLHCDIRIAAESAR
jgi:enoyl-CoA hydratase/carnithine racemase